MNKALLDEWGFINYSLISFENRLDPKGQPCFTLRLYTAKLSPHPQVREAFGLLNENPLPFRPPENSKVVLQR